VDGFCHVGAGPFASRWLGKRVVPLAILNANGRAVVAADGGPV
jgi:hypothetical protein